MARSEKEAVVDSREQMKTSGELGVQTRRGDGNRHPLPSTASQASTARSRANSWTDDLGSNVARDLDTFEQTVDSCANADETSSGGYHRHPDTDEESNPGLDDAGFGQFPEPDNSSDGDYIPSRDGQSPQGESPTTGVIDGYICDHPVGIDNPEYLKAVQQDFDPVPGFPASADDLPFGITPEGICKDFPNHIHPPHIRPMWIAGYTGGDDIWKLLKPEAQKYFRKEKATRKWRIMINKDKEAFHAECEGKSLVQPLDLDDDASVAAAVAQGLGEDSTVAYETSAHTRSAKQAVAQAGTQDDASVALTHQEQLGESSEPGDALPESAPRSELIPSHSTTDQITRDAEQSNASLQDRTAAGGSSPSPHPAPHLPTVNEVGSSQHQPAQSSQGTKRSRKEDPISKCSKGSRHKGEELFEGKCAKDTRLPEALEKVRMGVSDAEPPTDWPEIILRGYPEHLRIPNIMVLFIGIGWGISRILQELKDRGHDVGNDGTEEGRAKYQALMTKLHTTRRTALKYRDKKRNKESHSQVPESQSDSSDSIDKEATQAQVRGRKRKVAQSEDDDDLMNANQLSKRTKGFPDGYC